MRFANAVLPLLITTSWLIPTSADEKEKTDQDKFQGDWVVVSAMTDAADGGMTFKGRIFRINGEKVEIIKPSGDVEETGILKLDPKKTPKEYDLEVFKKEKRKGIYLGIYVIDGHSLTLCWSAKEGGSRPSGFDKVGGKDDFRVFVLERKKEKKE